MRNIKKTPIDMTYLTNLSMNKFIENNNIIINEENDGKIIQTNLKDLNKDNPLSIKLLKEPLQYFISINPMREISYNKLKYLLHLAYGRYLRFELGKRYRDIEPPIQMDIVIEEKDEKIKYNHIHIITKTPLFIYDIMYFIGILFHYLRQSIPNLNMFTENILDECKVFNYINKTKVIEIKDEKGKKQKKVVSKEQVLMNETYI